MGDDRLKTDPYPSLKVAGNHCWPVSWKMHFIFGVNQMLNLSKNQKQLFIFNSRQGTGDVENCRNKEIFEIFITYPETFLQTALR